MAQPSDTRTMLAGDGTSQQQRRLDALEPGFVHIDEREVEDFLVFALRLAERVRYYDLTNSAVDGSGSPYDWQSFFTRSTSVVIAKIQTTNPLPHKRTVSSALSAANTPQVLEDVFDGLLGLARTIDQWEREVGPSSGLKGHIGRLIEANLSTTLGQLVSYERAAADQIDGYESFDPGWWADFGPRWNLTDPGAVSADPSLFGGYESVADQVASAKNRLEEQFLTLYNTLVGIIQAAPGYFEASVEERSDHEPHIALFLTFLKLYMQVRDDANRLTGRHLDFYYEQVLGLTKKSAEPDQVHLVVTPAQPVFQARGIDEYKVEKGTAVDAGKDPTGVARIYTLDDDLVANLAQIESLKTVFVDREQAEEPSEAPNIRGIYSAPVANSGDGEGGEFEEEESPSWPTVGSTRTPPAAIGFIVASRGLLLREGTRRITVELHCADLPSDFGESTGSFLDDAFDLDLSGEEGWITRERVTPTVDGPKSDGTATLRIETTLLPAEGPVTFSNSEALGVDYGTTLPLLKVTLRHPASSGSSPYAYDLLKTLTLEDVTITTSVGNVEEDDEPGVSSLIVQNDQFVMDASKPFQPFGPFPEVGSHFYIGSAEVFEKNVTELTLAIEWDGLPGSFPSHYEGYDLPANLPGADDFTVDIRLLQDNSWVSIKPAEGAPDTVTRETLFVEETGGTLSSEKMVTLTGGDDDDLHLQEPRAIDELAPWQADTANGFLRLTLNHAFYHDAYPSVLTRQTLAAGRLPDEMRGALYKSDDGTVVKGDSDTTSAPGEVIIPREPYTPTIRSFSLTYEASHTHRVSADSTRFPATFQFIHLHPFTDRYETQDLTAESVYLLPQFNYEGALFLGIKSLEPGQNLSLLFQVVEGTGDPELPPPDVKWEYLSSNAWKTFEEYEVTTDTTNDLTRSGIVTFSVPRQIDSEGTTVLPSPLHWIRASVEKNAGAVSDLIGVHAQAVPATFSDRGNDPDHLKTPLPADQVSGLLVDDAAVASVEQPYASFGGRPAEENIPFYTRVSEQLRHKGRAITHFDYERLVLEEYPEIYKIRCIKHTRVSRAADATVQHELAPGHVLIAVIPDFTDLPAAKRRTPRVTLATLESIKSFLLGINSPFVQQGSVGPGRLHVYNPVYEEVRVAFDVKFIPSVTAIDFHVEELRTAIVRFLSPWAFEQGGDISFGGKVFKSHIINFVEKQSYVDYVADFEMMHMESDDDVDVIEVETPRSILVPAGAEEHTIRPITGIYCSMEHALSPQGIGAMTISDDFQILES